MNTIIDGYNLIFRMGWQGKSQASSALEKARQRLIGELASRIPMASRADIAIVFDAKRSPVKETANQIQLQGFRVLFAANHDEADALIEEMIAKHSAPKSLTVVSDDNRLQTAARRRKVKAVDCETWVERLTKQPKNGPSISATGSSKDEAIQQLAETDWLTEFQFGEEQPTSDAVTPEPTENFNPFPPGYGEDLLD